MRYCIKRTGDALGDHMMAAFFVRLLNDNGFSAVYGSPHYRDLVDVPLSSQDEDCHEFFFTYHQGELHAPTFTGTILQTSIERFKRAFGIRQQIEVRTRYVPVKFVELSGIPTYDVVMCTRTGVWSRYRNWPYFDELKQELKARDISYFDLSPAEIRGNECLNYAKKAKLFLGLETGVSHYVSQVVRKGLILQSGYSAFDFWCPYAYEELSETVPCRPCFIHCKTKPYICPFDHQCMRALTVSRVLTRIEQLLE